MTILRGYTLLVFSKKIALMENIIFKGFLFYLALLALIADPLNLSIGPLIYGGDANGIAVGLGINRWIIQAVFLIISMINRELIAQNLFPLFSITEVPFLFRPLISKKSIR